jgi:hypothetical protein
MDRVKRLRAASVCAVIVLTSVGCSTPQPVVSSPAPTSTASESDDAVLVKAIEAYTVFNAALDGYLAGSSELDALRPMTTDLFYSRLQSEESENASRITGASSFDTVELVENPPDAPEKANVAISLCRDVSQTAVISEHGDRAEAELMRVPLIVYFTRDPSATQNLLISEVDTWTVPGYCER